MPPFLITKPGIRSDLVIHWPNDRRRLRNIVATGRCPSHLVPRKVRNPDGRVVLADENGTPLVRFRLKAIEHGVNIYGPDGQFNSYGCVLVARRRSARLIRNGAPGSVPVNSYGIGQFFYTDPRSGQLRIYTKSASKSRKAARGGSGVIRRHDPRHDFLADTVGRTLQKPERELIAAYGKWIREEGRLKHYYLASPRLYTDFVLQSPWVLFEAKATNTRKAIRYALGQLFDYQRYFDRRPRLALLLPCHPHREMLRLCEAMKVAVVWRSNGGSFRDSVDGRYTSVLRDARSL